MNTLCQITVFDSGNTAGTIDRKLTFLDCVTDEIM